VGDCLEVRDTHELWAVARVVASIQDINLGPLILVHFEGWSTSWLMWIHPEHDAARVRVLGSDRAGLPGIGSRGAHTDTTFRSTVTEAHQMLLSGREWQPTGGRGRTYPFANGRTSFVAEGSDGYNGISLSEQLGRPWNELGGGTNFRRPCNLLVHSRDLCHEMYRRFCEVSGGAAAAADDSDSDPYGEWARSADEPPSDGSDSDENPRSSD